MNLAIIPKGKSDITHFLTNAKQEGRKIVGDNEEVVINQAVFDLVWTTTSVEPRVWGRGEVLVWSHTREQLEAPAIFENTPAGSETDVDKIIQVRIRALFPLETEVRILREHLLGIGGPEEFQAYQVSILDIVDSGKAFKDKTFKEEKGGGS